MNKSFSPYPIINTVKVFFDALLVSALVILVGAVGGGIFSTLLSVVWIVTLVYTSWIFIKAGFQKVTLGDHSITYTVGILSSKNTSIPYSKISEANHGQTVFQRLFRVGDLKVDSAGGSIHAIHVKDLKYTDIKKILDHINKR